MSSASRRRTITLRDGVRVTLRAIAPEDKPLLAAMFERLSEESRYRRFFATKDELSAAELDYFAGVDHQDHEAIIALEPSSGEALGVARYIRWTDDTEAAEVAVTVADDWQGRGLGRALLDRLTYRARREGVRRFSAFVQSDNQASLGLVAGVGDTQSQLHGGVVELLIELPPKRGMGAQLTRALRAAAAGTLVPSEDTRPPRRRRRGDLGAPACATGSSDPDDCRRRGRLGDGSQCADRRAAARHGPGSHASRGQRVRRPSGAL
jgi:L-amino acid N-acyltransferase YncA